MSAALRTAGGIAGLIAITSTTVFVGTVALAACLLFVLASEDDHLREVGA